MSSGAVKLTLESVELRVVAIPMRRPIVSKVGAYENWPYVLIDVKTREGIVGRSYLEPYLVNSAKYIVAAIKDLVAQLKGTPVAPHDAMHAATRAFHLIGRQGLSVAAASGLDMALWDACAKAANLPLVSLLGGTPGSVRAYNTNGLWLIPLNKLGKEAEDLVAEGNFSAIKIRLGRESLKDDLAAISIVRKAVGENVTLMCDFNQGLPFGEALLRLHALDDQGLYWFEEPIVWDLYESCAQLARELKTPLQIGENIYGPRDFYRAVQANAADLYMPDLMRIGGVSGWMRAASIAGAAGLPLSSHLYPEVSGHCLRVSDTADWLEWRDWANPILAEPFAVNNGFVEVPNRVGNGIEWDEAAVRRYALT